LFLGIENPNRAHARTDLTAYQAGRQRSKKKAGQRAGVRAALGPPHRDPDFELNFAAKRLVTQEIAQAMGKCDTNTFAAAVC